MKTKIDQNIKYEILSTLKSGYFTVTTQSKICDIFEVHERFYKLFERNPKVKITREAKIELIKWLDSGFINDEDENLAKLIKHPTFLDIMKAANIDEDV